MQKGADASNNVAKKNAAENRNWRLEFRLSPPLPPHLQLDAHAARPRRINNFYAQSEIKDPGGNGPNNDIRRGPRADRLPR